jgi:hypothetical protein
VLPYFGPYSRQRGKGRERFMHCLPLRWNVSRSVSPYDNGIFKSCTSAGDLCVHRSRFDRRTIDLTHGEVEMKDWQPGEDPRVYEAGGRTYVVSNHKDRMALLQINGSNVLKRWRLPFKGKNVIPYLSWLQRGARQVAFLDMQAGKGFTVRIDPSSNSAVITERRTFRVRVLRNPHCNATLSSCALRGGSAGVKMCSGVVGLGHCTLCPQVRAADVHKVGTEPECCHLPFLWHMTPSDTVSVYPLCLSKKRIVDPTTLFKAGRMITAESDTWWFTDKQQFVNQEYRAW